LKLSRSGQKHGVVDHISNITQKPHDRSIVGGRGDEIGGMSAVEIKQGVLIDCGRHASFIPSDVSFGELEIPA